MWPTDSPGVAFTSRCPQVAPRVLQNHFTMGAILLTLGSGALNEAAFFMETVLRFDQNYAPAYDHLLQIRCAQREAKAEAKASNTSAALGAEQHDEL